MRFRVQRNPRSLAKPLPLLWRRSAILLLFVFVWDLGFELLAPLHFDHETSSARVSVANAPETDPHPDCGLPDHQCALSHHHHFPALISAEHSIILSVATEHLPGTLPVTTRHRASATRLIRGPPANLISG